MYHIILCDDDKDFMPYMKKMLEKADLLVENTIFYEYTSGKEMLDNITEDMKCDLLILDVQMPQLDGNETAIEFRRIFPDAVLVFCSGECQPTVKSFKVAPFRYLLKEYTDEEIVKELKEVLGEVKKRAKHIQFIEGHYRNDCIRVRVSNIVYIEKWKRGSKIHVCADCREAEFGKNILSSYMLDELYTLLQNMGFEYAHNSYIVNFNYVERTSGCEIHIQDEEILTMSKKYIHSFKSKRAKWISGKY